VDKLGLSARAFNRILKIARTLADLAGKDHIGTDQIARAPETIQCFGGASSLSATMKS